jgi:hypothetical protein
MSRYPNPCMISLQQNRHNMKLQLIICCDLTPNRHIYEVAIDSEEIVFVNKKYKDSVTKIFVLRQVIFQFFREPLM